MQLTSILTVALSALSFTSAAPVTAAARAASPSLTWYVSDFNTGCSPGGCLYSFHITGIASQNTPGFSTHCNGTTTQEDYAVCDNEHVEAQVKSELYPAWNVKAKHSWYQNQGQAEFFALGQANVTSTMKNFTIPVTEVYGVA